MCAACPKMCRHVCPTFFAWRSDSPTPHGRAFLVHQDIVGTRSLDERGVEILYQCLECSHCLTWCKPEIDIASIVENIRTELVQSNKQPKRLNQLRENITKHHNPFGEEVSKRFEWYTPKPSSNGKRVLYFVGCTASYREQNIAESTVSLLSSLGFEVVVNSSEECCGSPLLRTGFLEEGMKQATKNAEMINMSDCDSVVITCPGCYRALSQDTPSHGITINKPIQHISELLAEHLDKIHPTEDTGITTYHDPCHLARHLGVYDAPREVIKHLTGTKFAEMERHGDNAMCCGNGAGLRTLFPDESHTIGAERVNQATLTEAQYLITACPFCKNMLESESNGRIKVLDIPEFVLAKSKIDN